LIVVPREGSGNNDERGALTRVDKEWTGRALNRVTKERRWRRIILLTRIRGVACHEI